ncbi:hypothetical protein Tco_1129095, partial [Tanacetum coccineum]
EDDVESGVIFGRSFLRMTKGIIDFGVGTITIYPDIDAFLEETEEESKSNNDWDHLLDFNIDDVPLLGEEGLPPFVCKMGKKEAAKEAIAIRMSRKFALLEEERPIIETMAYHDKYKKILDKVWKDKVELDGKIIKEEEEAVKRIKGEALKEKDYPEAFIFPISLEGQVNENALAYNRSNINTMPYQIYEKLGREDMKKVDRGITMINQTQAEAMDIPNRHEAPLELLMVFVTKTSCCKDQMLSENTESDCDDEGRVPDSENNSLVHDIWTEELPFLNCNASS